MAGLGECGKLDIRNIPNDDLVVIGEKAWVKFDVEEKVYLWKDKPYAVIKFSDACFAQICDDQAPIPKGLLFAVNNINLLNNCGGDDGGNANDPSIENATTQTATTINANTTSGENFTNLETATTSVDIASINSRGFQGAAVIPSAAVIPMKSNIKTYGPYASSNFGSSCGGTQVEVNPEICPWVFGSIEGMNAAGSSIVESMAIGLIRAESGGVTVPGLPSFSNLGIALGGGGPTLSAINFSYGSSGVSTSYEFKTYTPKFGGLNRHTIDRIKDISKNRTEQIRFLRNSQIVQNKIGRKLQRLAAQAQQRKDDLQKPKQGGKTSLQRVFVSEIYDWQSFEQQEGITQRTVVGIETLNKSVGEMMFDYGKKAYISLDGLFGPISKAGDGGLPRYASFEVGEHKASPDLPTPPFAIQPEEEQENEEFDPFVSGLNQYNLEITQQYTDPLTRDFEEEGHHHDGGGTGHVIDMVGRSETFPGGGITTNFYQLTDDERYADDYRFLGMRGPILLHSWGYDLQGKPIPNESDTEGEARQGTFVKEELKDAFLQNWLGKPATWPVAPIDFRFDRKRGLWVTPPGYKVVVAKLDESLEPYGTCKASLINEDTENPLKKYGEDLVDKDGNKVDATDGEDGAAKIRVADRIGKKYSKGSKAYCYYDTYNSEYIILDSVATTTIRFKVIDFCEGSPPEPSYGDSWTSYAGYGDKFPNNHILGIRINCAGTPVDVNGEILNEEDLLDEEKAQDIFVNLYDTCGNHGPSYAYYTNFQEWSERASTGFATVCAPPIGSGESCGLGETDQCEYGNPDYTSYDILFIDSYARFVECTLTENLYVDEEADDFKKDNPDGNAAADINNFYGGSPNIVEPKFYAFEGGGLEEVDFRVFDPFFDEDQQKPLPDNPFAHLKAGDKVLAVFDETRKKYVIYNSLNKADKIIKFALVDNKDLTVQWCRAVLVDLEGYPIDAAGQRLNADNFEDNFIIVFDSMILHGRTQPVPQYHNFTKTGFGPALGSDNFQEHLTGIPLKGGDQDPRNLPNDEEANSWTGGPFTGFAISRAMPEDAAQDYVEFDRANEIFFLESFAKIVSGKIATKEKVVNNQYYLGVLAISSDDEPNGFDGHSYGRIPFTRDDILEEPKFNLRVEFPLTEFAGGKYVTGDWYDEDHRVDGDVFNSVDGCYFIAYLDHAASKVTGGKEELIYTIKEVENVANRAKMTIKTINKANELNAGTINLEPGQDEQEVVVCEFLDGFMWDKEKSKTNYEKITFYNRTDWTGKPFILPWEDESFLHIHSHLVGLIGLDEEDPKFAFQVDHAGTIAQVSETNIPEQFGGRFGVPGEIEKTDLVIDNFIDPAFYHGLDPSNNNVEFEEGDDAAPVFEVNDQWMTYNNSKIVGLWNENKGGPNIHDGAYRVVYAREAPVLITAKATSDFSPKDSGVSVELGGEAYASCPGVTNEPIPTLIASAKNPMGYGAEAGDFVTLQRVHINVVENDANYYYIVIGTGQPPGSC
jgi:hypothetical protein